MLWWTGTENFFFPASSCPSPCLQTVQWVGRASALAVSIIYSGKGASCSPSFPLQQCYLKEGFHPHMEPEKIPFREGWLRLLLKSGINTGLLCKYCPKEPIPSSSGTDEGFDLWRSNLEETHERNTFGIFHQWCFDLPYGL